MSKRLLGFALALLFVLAAHAADTRPRLVVLTDIGGDPDDQQSLIRLLIYSNNLDIDGLIASAAGTPGELKEKVTKPELIRELVEAYGQVRPNLVQHAKGYPPVDELLSVIKSGNPVRGLAGIGEGKDTEGSNWIISMADQNDPRLLNIAIWGGQTDFAQALWRVRNDRSEEDLQKFIRKLRIYDINDQDKIVDWIWKEFPTLWYILAKAPDGKDKRLGTYRGMYLGGDLKLTSADWINAHIKQHHGPLGALYPMKTFTDPNPYKTMKEGDSPSWLYFLANGLNDAANPSWGGWGGRYAVLRDHLYRDALDTVDGVTEARASVWRWRLAFQNDFAARMDWCVKPFADANHKPKATINNLEGIGPIRLTASPGTFLKLDASGSSDPDNDKLTFNWWFYSEASSVIPTCKLDAALTARPTLHIPKDATAGDWHIILEVTDDGDPALTSYRRVIVTIKP
jgi:hypothetical protein